MAVTHAIVIALLLASIFIGIAYYATANATPKCVSMAAGYVTAVDVISNVATKPEIKTMTGLEFASTNPIPGHQQQLKFPCINEFEGYRISVTVHAAVDTSGIDTSAGDVTTTAPVDHIEFAVTDGFGMRVGSMTIKSDRGNASSPNVAPTVNERCEAVAKHLFSTGLTFTMFAHGELQ